MNKVRFGRTAAAVACATALTLSAGCSASAPGASGQAPTGDTTPVTLTFGAQLPDGDVDAFKLIADDYMAAHSNIKIDLQEAPVADYANLMRTQLQAGNAPDIIYGSAGTGNPNSLLGFAEAGYLLPLTDLSFVTDRIPASSDALYKDKAGAVYGLPLSAVVVGQVANLAAYKELGIEPATTFDDFLGQCKVAGNAGKSLVSVAGSSSSNAGILVLELAAGSVYAADPDWNQKRAAGDVTFASSPEWHTALANLQKMNEANCFTKGSAAAGREESVSAVAKGDALSRPATSSFIGELKTSYPDGQFGFVPLPAPQASDTRAYASLSIALGINAATKHKDAALAFLEYFAGKDASEKYANTFQELPLTAFANKEFPAEYDAISTLLADPSKTMPLANLTFKSGAVYEALGVGFQGILTGQATPDQVLKAADAAWDA